MTDPHPTQSSYVCPVCGRPMMSANELCSGSFLDTDHPSNVQSVVGSPPLRRGMPDVDADPRGRERFSDLP